MARHVGKGRAKLNFSDWSGATANQLEEIYDAIDKDDMPPRDYRLMHPEARLSNGDREILKAWTTGPQSTGIPAREDFAVAFTLPSGHQGQPWTG
jgi:hypothetical protein